MSRVSPTESKTALQTLDDVFDGMQRLDRVREAGLVYQAAPYIASHDQFSEMDSIQQAVVHNRLAVSMLHFHIGDYGAANAEQALALVEECLEENLKYMTVKDARDMQDFALLFKTTVIDTQHASKCQAAGKPESPLDPQHDGQYFLKKFRDSPKGDRRKETLRMATNENTST